MKISIKIYTALLIFVSQFFALSAQDLSGDLGKSLNLTGGVQPEITAEISSWNSRNNTGTITVFYNFPEGYHQTDSSDFFKVEPENTAEGSIVFGSQLKDTDVPVVDGTREYHGKTAVVTEFHVSGNSGGAKKSGNSGVSGNPGVSDDNKSLEKIQINLTAHYQMCADDGTCLFPQQKEISLTFNPLMQDLIPEGITLEILKQNGSMDTPVSETLNTSLEKPVKSLWFYILMAFIGGILLNVMPCVLPLLTVKALSLVKQAHQEKKEILKHSWLYVAGIEISFWAMAAIVIVLQASGRLLGWGFQFQSPAFVLILDAVIFVFALSMFDVFVIEAPQFSLKGSSSAGEKGGYIGSFLTGIFAVLVATPCTAPFLGAALGFAFSQPPVVITAIFSAVGLGLGLPFLLLGFWPGIIKKMPKPGNWMNVFKEVMGFLLLGTTVYLFTTFRKLNPSAVSGALWWFLFLSFSAWLTGKARNPLSKKLFRISGQAAALIIAVASAFLFVDFSGTPSAAAVSSLNDKTGENTVAFSEKDVLDRINSGEPVFLEFTASWCTTCKVNQRVLHNEKLKVLMKQKDIVHIKGDLTSYDETLTAWLKKFGRVGVPLYVFYPPGKDPVVFPELLTLEGLEKEFNKIEASAR